jgi:hypothetical protein
VGDDNNPSDRRVDADTDGDGLKDELWGHGTHVAGIVDVVAPAAKIMPLRVLDTEGYGNVFAIAKTVGFAERNGAKVINLSLGSSSRSKLLRNEIKRATANGVLVAAAAGNANSTVPHYPAAGNGVAASADGLVAVSSVNIYGQKSDFANYGSWVDIAAPGESILSAFPISKYAYWSGTSMATPFVSGEAALIYAVDSVLKPAGVEERIRCSARPLIETDPDFGAMLGAGHADAGASVTPGTCDTSAPPRTTITAAPWGLTNIDSAIFVFASSKVGSTFECKLDDAPFKACTSPKEDLALKDGQHTFAVRATDAVGNTDSTPAIRTWSVDTTAPNAPVIGSPADNGYNNSGDITVSGTVEAGSSVELFEGGTSTGTVNAGPDGAWSIQVSGVPNGEHTYTATAEDQAGNTSDASAGFRIIVDTVAPSASLTAPADRATVRRTVSLSSYAADNVEMKRVEFLIDGSVVATDASAPYGFNWSTTGVPDGAKSIAARAYDAAGNQTTSAARTVFVDNTAPATPTRPDLVVSSDSGSDSTDNVTSDTTPSFDGTAEAGSIVELLANGVSLGTTSAASGGILTLTPVNALDDGTHSITAKATDRAGNPSPASKTLSVIIDTQASQTGITSGPEGLIGSSSAEFTFSYSEQNSSFECKLDGGNYESCRSPKAYQGLGDGLHTFSVQAVDLAGNVDQSPAERSFTIDTVKPNAPTIRSPQSGGFDTDGNITVSGNAEADAKVELFEGDAFWGTATADARGTWSIELTGVAEGVHTYVAKATDAANNTSAPSADLMVNVDTKRLPW